MLENVACTCLKRAESAYCILRCSTQHFTFEVSRLLRTLVVSALSTVTLLIYHALALRFPCNARGRHRTREFALHRKLSGGHWVFKSETGGDDLSAAGGGRYGISLTPTTEPPDLVDRKTTVVRHIGGPLCVGQAARKITYVRNTNCISQSMS